MGKINAPGVYRVGQYSWIAKPDDILSGRVTPRFKVKLDSFTHPITNQPIRQRVLSVITGIPESRISEYASGKRPISPTNVRKICEVFRCSPDEILGVVDTSMIDTNA